MSRFQELYKADLTRYAGSPGFYLRRLLYYFRRSHTTRFKPMQLLWRTLYRTVASRRGIEISSQTDIGGGFYLGHAYNITINAAAKIGKNCNIHKGVVIGQTNRGKNKGVPTIGNEVWIGINAAIVGNITIGDDVLIAPNSFVNVDVPSHSVVYGNPCIIRPRLHATEGYINRIG
jgi:serine O-acetyltransferase